MVDDLAARGVHEVRPWREPVEDPGAHEVRRVGRQREVHAEHVAALGHLLRRLQHGDVEIAGQRRHGRRAVANESADSRPPRASRTRGARRAISWPMLPNPSSRACGRTDRAPSSTRSCSTGPRAGRRRCRECADRAPGSARRPARPRRSSSCPDSSTRRCRAATPRPTSIVFTPAPARTTSDSAPGVEHRLGDLRRPHDEHVGAASSDRATPARASARSGS